MTHRDPYARLLRWYPRWWRDAHGAVFLGTLREQSDHCGHSLLNVWGPLGLLGAVIGTVQYAYSDAPLSARTEPALTIGSALLGIALAWWVLGRLHGSRTDRLVAGASVALGCVAFQGAYVLPLAVFVAPLLAAVLAARGDLRFRRGHTQDSASAPLAGT